MQKQQYELKNLETKQVEKTVWMTADEANRMNASLLGMRSPRIWSLRTFFQQSLDSAPSVRIYGREVKGIAQNEIVEHDWTANVREFDMRPFPIGFFPKNSL